MAVFNGVRMAGVQATRPEGGDASMGKVMISRVDVPTSVVINDVLRSAPIPRRSTITDVMVISADIDGGAAASFSCGYTPGNGATVAGYFFTGAVTPRTGGVIRAQNMLDGPVVCQADTTVDVLVAAAPATPIAGPVFIVVSYMSNIS